MNEKKTLARSELVIFRRILKIDHLIASGTFPNTKTFMADDEIGGSPATIGRYIRFMKDELYAPIEFDRYKNGYYYFQKSYRLPALFLNEKQEQSIKFLCEYISTLDDTPIQENLKSVLDLLINGAIKSPLGNPDVYSRNYNLHDNTEMDWMKDRVFACEDTENGISDKNWYNIIKAAKEFRIITFDSYWMSKTYSMEHNQKPEKIKAAPYQIIFQNKRWFLWANVSGTNQFRRFWLDKIDNIEITSEKFVLPYVYDWRILTSGEYIEDISGIKAEVHGNRIYRQTHIPYYYISKESVTSGGQKKNDFFYIFSESFLGRKKIERGLNYYFVEFKKPLCLFDPNSKRDMEIFAGIIKNKKLVKSEQVINAVNKKNWKALRSNLKTEFYKLLQELDYDGYYEGRALTKKFNVGIIDIQNLVFTEINPEKYM